jgi:hypothetical protein
VVRRLPSSRLGLDGDRLGRADGLAELAGDAAFLAIGIAAERVLPPEARALGVALMRIEHGRLGAGHVLQAERERAGEVHQHRALHRLSNPVEHHFPLQT